MSALTLARAQFALTVMVHYLYPVLTMGLGVVLVIVASLRLRRPDETYQRMARFWTHIFGVVFAGGVATGVVMEFEFGTNWARYSRFVGDIFGAPLAAEALIAFFLESSFLSILVFGEKRVSRRTHLVCHSHGRLGCDPVCLLDRGGQFLATDARWLPHRARPRGADGLCRRRVQPVDALAFLARRAGLVGHGRGVRCLAQFVLSCARPAPGVLPALTATGPRVWLGLTGSRGRGGRCPHPSGCPHPAGEIRGHRGPVPHANGCAFGRGGPASARSASAQAAVVHDLLRLQCPGSPAWTPLPPKIARR